MSRNVLQVVLLKPNQKTLNKTENAFCSSLSKLLKDGNSNAMMLCQRTATLRHLCFGKIIARTAAMLL